MQIIGKTAKIRIAQRSWVGENGAKVIKMTAWQEFMGERVTLWRGE